MKRLSALVAALLLLGSAKPAVSLTVHVQQTSFDLLDVLAIQVTAHNPHDASASLKFETPNEYAVEIARGNDVVFSSIPATASKSSVPAHMRALSAGSTTLGTFEWNELAKDGSSPSAGRYAVRVRMLNDGAQPTAAVTIDFVQPTPIAAVAKLKPGDAITIAGHLDAKLQQLTDATGSIKLSHRLLGAPNASVAVRGYIVAAADGTRTIGVTRWAPLH